MVDNLQGLPSILSSTIRLLQTLSYIAISMTKEETLHRSPKEKGYLVHSLRKCYANGKHFR